MKLDWKYHRRSKHLFPSWDTTFCGQYCKVIKRSRTLVYFVFVGGDYKLKGTTKSVIEAKRIVEDFLIPTSVQFIERLG